MYLRCDGTLTVDTDNKPVCDAWVSVTDDELLGAALQAHKLTAEDYTQLAGMTLVILLAAFGIKQVMRVLLPTYFQ